MMAEMAYEKALHGQGGDRGAPIRHLRDDYGIDVEAMGTPAKHQVFPECRSVLSRDLMLRAALFLPVRHQQRCNAGGLFRKRV